MFVTFEKSAAMKYPTLPISGSFHKYNHLQYIEIQTCLTFCPVSIIHMVITEPVQAVTT